MNVLSRLFRAPAPYSAPVSSISPFDARELLRTGAVLVDVRGKGEWDAGHAPKARHHPLAGLPDSLAGVPADRTIIVVCRSGNRSAKAAKVLTRAGFDAVNLTGGMMAWKVARMPMVNSRGRKGSVR